MKLWTSITLCAASLLILSGCAKTSVPTKEAVVDPTLPLVKLTKNGSVADINAVGFEWKSLNDQRVKGIYVYKRVPSQNAQSGEHSYYSTIENRFATHYVDNGVNPDTRYSYFFKTFSNTAESLPSKIVTVNSLPVLDSVSWIHSVTGMPRTAKIIWRPHTNQKVKLYIIERKTPADEGYQELARVDGRLSAEYIDKDLKDKHLYNYRVRVLTYDDILSTPSKIVKVVTKPLPKDVTNVKATVDLPKKVKLTWNKSKEKDFNLYYVYKSETLEGSYELIATLKNNRHVDKIDVDGQEYFYRVSAVDTDGLESKKNNTIIGKTLSRPAAPSLVEAKLIDGSIEVTWSNSDKRVKSYTVRKTEQKSWFDKTSQDVSGIESQKFIDKNVQDGVQYLYTIYSVDKNKILSEPSVEVVIKTPASEELLDKAKDKALEEAIKVNPDANSKTDAKNGEKANAAQNLDLNEL